MRQALLGLLLAVTASGCGDDTGADTGPGSTTVQTTAPVGDAWAEARSYLDTVTSGTYEATLISQRCSKASAADCSLVSQAISDKGSFSTSPITVESEVRLERAASEAGGAASTRVLARLVPDGTLYTQDVSAGESCWTRWGKNAAQDLSASFRSGLAVLRAAEVTYDLPSSSSKVELTAEVDALTVIRTLGVPEALDRNYGIDDGVRKVLAARTVGIVLQIGPDGSTIGFEADGRQVATEIYGGQIDLATSFLVAVQNSRATFQLGRLATAPAVQAPRPDQIRPANAPAGTTCAA